LGVTVIQAAAAGKLTKVTAKPVGNEYTRGRVIGSLESGTYFGTVKTPLEESSSPSTTPSSEDRSSSPSRRIGRDGSPASG